MKQIYNFTIAVLSLFCYCQSSELIIYENVPNLKASDQYQFRVRKVGEQKWQKPFAFYSESKKTSVSKFYFNHLEEWSHTYINFEMNAPVEIEISKPNLQPIKKASAHPKKHIESCQIREGKVFIRLKKPSLFAVDIDGQMYDQHTGMGYNGPPIHSLSIFANPIIKNKPSLEDKEVYYLKPGEKAPTQGDWKTLYFLPGIHDIGLGYELKENKNYYLPGNALVYGTMYNYGKWSKGHDIKIFGCGTLSGERLKNPEGMSPQPKDKKVYHPIHVDGARNVTIEGITIEDPAYHSIMLINGKVKNQPCHIKWTKIIGWRKNGDGINPFGNVGVQDCFIRTQDDGIYASGLGIKRTTFWHDANGSAFVLTALPNHKLTIEDCDVIYSRASWHNWTGGRIFNIRGEGAGHMGKDVIFKNIRVSDPYPTLQHFFLCMRVDPPYDDSNTRIRKHGHLSGVKFIDISIQASSVNDLPEILWGSEGAMIKNITFENVHIGGQKLVDMQGFKSNAYVKDILFK